MNNENTTTIELSYYESWRNRGVITRHVPKSFKMFLNGTIVTINILATGNEYVGFEVCYETGYLRPSARPLKPRVDRKLLKIKSFLGSYLKYAANV